MTLHNLQQTMMNIVENDSASDGSGFLTPYFLPSGDGDAVWPPVVIGMGLMEWQDGVVHACLDPCPTIYCVLRLLRG
jgi:hypothetical protein